MEGAASLQGKTRTQLSQETKPSSRRPDHVFSRSRRESKSQHPEESCTERSLRPPRSKTKPMKNIQAPSFSRIRALTQEQPVARFPVLCTHDAVTVRLETPYREKPGTNRNPRCGF